MCTNNAQKVCEQPQTLLEILEQFGIFIGVLLKTFDMLILKTW